LSGRSGVSAERRKLPSAGNSNGGFLPKAATPKSAAILNSVSGGLPTRRYGAKNFRLAETLAPPK
jgi:hypothetical protein